MVRKDLCYQHLHLSPTTTNTVIIGIPLSRLAKAAASARDLGERRLPKLAAHPEAIEIILSSKLAGCSASVSANLVSLVVVNCGCESMISSEVGSIVIVLFDRTAPLDVYAANLEGMALRTLR